MVRPTLSPPILRAGVSRLALAAACSSPTCISFNVRRFNKLGGRHPPTAMVGRGACQVRGGAGPRTKHGVSVQPTQKQGRNPVCFTCKTSQHVLPCRKAFGPTPRGVIQRQCSAGNRAHANWAIGLSSTVAANLAARCGGGAASSLAPLAPCSSLTGVFCTPFQQIWRRAAPLRWLRWALVRCGDGAGPRAKHGVRSYRPTKTSEAWGRLGRNPVYRCC